MFVTKGTKKKRNRTKYGFSTSNKFFILLALTKTIFSLPFEFWAFLTFPNLSACREQYNVYAKAHVTCVRKARQDIPRTIS